MEGVSAVIDHVLRGPKESALAPVARHLPARTHPTALTVVGAAPGIGAAFAVADGREVLAVALWLINRIIDGVDGTLARLRDRQTDLGGYLDILMDFVVYTAVPIGLAVRLGTTAAWVASAALLATFTLNTISWSYLSAILERRGQGTAQYTTVTMPTGIVEGAETIVFFTLMLAVPVWSTAVMWIMAGAVLATVVQRIVWAVRAL